MNTCLNPIVGNNPKILILGSMPGRESLKKQEYYAHAQNRFWKILFSYFNKEYGCDYNQKKELITSNNIALWDVIKCCDRPNSSLDSLIINETVNDIPLFINKHNSIKAVFLNGTKAYSLYKQHFSCLPVAYTLLPSVSPANARLAFDELFKIWKARLDSFLMQI